MKPAWALATTLLLLACRERPAADAPAEASEPVTEAGEPLPDADLNASLGELGADPERPGEAPRFVGRWAAAERLCATAAWRFAADGLETPAGSACRFEQVREVPGGYDIAARCTAEGPERADTIRLRFPESAGGMTFEADAIADSGLVRCGDG